jgi:hypothetical protein
MIAKAAVGTQKIPWGLALLYAAWKPNSLRGWLLVGPFRMDKGLDAIKRYWAGALGFALVACGIAVIAIASW